MERSGAWASAPTSQTRHAAGRMSLLQQLLFCHSKGPLFPAYRFQAFLLIVSSLYFVFLEADAFPPSEQSPSQPQPRSSFPVGTALP